MAKTTKTSINKDTNLGQLVVSFPEIGRVLAEDYGLHCVGCMVSQFDTLEQGMKIHGYNNKDIALVVKKLSKMVK